MKRSVKLCLFGLVGIFPLLFACGGGGGNGEAAQDGAPPIVSTVSPGNGAANVPTTTTVAVTFNEAMNPATINAATFMVTTGVTQVVGTISSTGTTYTFTPSASLATGTVYTATVTAGVMDVAGNVMSANFTSSFTTSSAPDTTLPTVSAVSPANGAINVPTTATVAITFNEAMNSSTISTATFTVTAGGTQVAGTISSTGTTYTFTPSASLAGGTLHTVTVTTGARDVAGNAIAANFMSTFTTAIAPANCITAGNRTPDAISCCPGLTRIFVAYYDPAVSCEELSRRSIADGTLYYICSAVGNGICEPWENRCNDPQDCKFP